MTDDIVRFRLLLLTLAGWISRHQQDVIDYLVEENRVLKEQLGRQDAQRLTDDQRMTPRCQGQAPRSADAQPRRNDRHS